MRIAVFIKNTTFHSGFGGFETQNKVLCEGLAQKGHAITVFSPKKELEFEQKEENGVKYVFVPCIFKRFSVLYSASKQSWQKKSFEVFRKMHNENKFGLVISQSSWALGIIKHKSELDIPIVAISHGSKIGEVQTVLKSVDSPGDFGRFLVDIPHILRAFFITQRQFIHGSDKVVAVSNAVKEQVVNETYVSEDKVVVIHNGINPGLFESGSTGGVDDGGVNLVYVGRIEKSKGLFLLLDAVESLDFPNLKLRIVGDGVDFDELKNYSLQKGLDDVVNLEGKIPYDKVVQRLAVADIFVLPTLRVEGFPMTLVEAMFSGLPIVASDIGGNSDAVVDGETGFLVEPGNTDQLKEKLSLLVSDRDLRVDMSVAALGRAKHNFTLDAMLNKYEQVFDEVLKNENS